MAKQGSCRFCGQQLIIENGDEMTEPQREEHATRNCDCDEAKNIKNRHFVEIQQNSERMSYLAKVPENLRSRKICCN